MYTIITFFQNFIQVLLDLIFKRIVIGIKKILFLILQPFLQNNKRRIEKQVINTEKLNQNSMNDGLSILALTSTMDSLGVVASNSFEQFYFQIPDKYKNQLNEYKFSLNGESDSSSKYYAKLISLLSKYYNFSIEDTQNLISNQICIVSQLFLDEMRAGRQKSNNKMFGIDKIVKRGNLLELKLFVTDYFTYTCINHVYRYLKRKYPENKSLFIATLEDVNNVSPFLCNFGVGGFLSLNYAGKEVYFIGKRSSAVACPNVWQTSFDETFDLRDRPNVQGAPPNLKTCLERGVKEELGFMVFEHGFRLESSLLSVIQTKERFEIELFVMGHCLLNYMKEFEDIILQMYSAPDFENENEVIQLIPRENVSQFFQGLEQKGESHTIEALDLWLAFMKIRNMQNVAIKFIHSLTF